MGISSSLVASVLPAYPTLDQEEKAQVLAAVTEFMGAELSLAPWHIRFGLTTIGIGCVAFCRLWLRGRRIDLVPAERRTATFAAWERFSGNPGRGFMRALRSMTTLAFYDHPQVLLALGVTNPREHQEERRQYRARRLREAPL